MNIIYVLQKNGKYDPVLSVDLKAMKLGDRYSKVWSQINSGIVHADSLGFNRMHSVFDTAGGYAGVVDSMALAMGLMGRKVSVVSNSVLNNPYFELKQMTVYFQ